MTEWQPIETAPKDGQRVQLLIPYNRKKFTEAECTDAGHWDANVAYMGQRGCWRFDGDDGPFDIQPTHWRPLPEGR